MEWTRVQIGRENEKGEQGGRITRDATPSEKQSAVTVFSIRKWKEKPVAGMSHANAYVLQEGRRKGKEKMTKEKVQWLNKA